MKWYKCPRTERIYSFIEVFDNFMVIPNKFKHHLNMSVLDRINLILDPNSFIEQDSSLKTADPLKFKDGINYRDKVRSYENRGLGSAVVTGVGSVEGLKVQTAFFDFTFIGGSLGSLEGEKLARCIERSVVYKKPLLIFSASSGARMHEGIFSLCQLAKVNSALKKLSLSRIPYLSVLTNPCMGGAMASFSSIGDFLFAEPNSLIGFAGPRVIKSTVNKGLPEGFQSSEFLLAKGLLDKVVDRDDLKSKLAVILRGFYN